jgi:hypothetical protein
MTRLDGAARDRLRRTVDETMDMKDFAEGARLLAWPPADALRALGLQSGGLPGAQKKTDANPP